MNAAEREQCGRRLEAMTEMLLDHALGGEVLNHALELVAHLRAEREAVFLPDVERQAAFEAQFARSLYLRHRNDQLVEAVRRRGRDRR